MKSWIETYKKDLRSYKATTKLVDYITTVDSDPSSEDLTSDEEQEQAPAKYDRRYYRKLSVKLEAKFTSHTLEYLDDLWKEFADLYNLPPLVTLLDCICKDSILVVWLIPAHLAHRIFRAAPGSLDVFHKHQITRVEFDGVCIYPEAKQHSERSPPPVPLLDLTLLPTSPSSPLSTPPYSRAKVLHRAEKSIEIACTCEKPPFDPDKHPWPEFQKAWKAIENGQISTLEEAISGSPELLIAKRSIVGNGVEYAITLLAFCGFHGRQDMVELLLEKGADINAGPTCNKHGVPLSQMMLHGLAQHEYDKLDTNILEYFIQKKADLHGGIYSNIMFRYSMLDLPLAINRVDCAKALVKAGADPITGGYDVGEDFVVVPMFQEYFDYGTNEYICWLLNDHIPKHPEVDLVAITDRIAKSIINMNKKAQEFGWWESQRRTPAHAILTCGHRNTIRLVQSKCKDIDGSLDLCDVRSFTGKTALHIAAENDDVKSVHILLELGADTLASDNSDMNPFMLAVQKGNLTVAKTMMKMNPDLISIEIAPELKMVHWALEKHLNTFFQCAFEEDLETLLTVTDTEGKGISHLAAASGNTEVFKILWSEKFANDVLSASNRDYDGKNPLELAVEHEHVSILSTLKQCIDGGRSGTTPKWHLDLRKKWWRTMRPYFLYASCCGSIDTVKYFVADGYEPNISIDGRTPLLCAAMGGHYEIMTYLLQFRRVLSDLKEQETQVDSASESPLLVAAQNGHTKCVTLLLQKGSDVLQTDTTGRNCLMIAIQNHHKDTALAILSVEGGLTALETDQNPNSLKLLIKEMPDLAEFVLNKCITERPCERKRQFSVEGSNFVDSPIPQEVHYNFAYLETEDTSSPNHVLNWMVRYKRLKLLQHPLVENLLFQKFWLMIFPLFAVGVMLYLIFLVGLTYFVFALPRPGPDSETCPENVIASSTNGNVTFFECSGQSKDTRRVLGATADTLCIFSSLGFLWKLSQLVLKGWKKWENYFQLLLWTLTLIFIFGFDNKCWCSTNWQWQTGAVTVFLSWFNVILILKYMPYAAVPINTFLSICFTFLKLSFLPIILVFAFGVPYYMVFVHKSASSETHGSLGHALAKTVLQLVGEFDFEATFSHADLYSPTAYILFFISVITMPVLFTNQLIGLAVGDTRQQIMEAEFTELQIWVEVILKREWIWRLLQKHLRTTYRPSDELLSYSKTSKDYDSCNSFILRLLGKYIPESRFLEFYLKLLGKEYTRHAKIVKKLKERNVNIYKTVVEHDAMSENITTFKKDVSNFRQEVETFKQEHDAMSEDIMTFKKDVSKFRQEMETFKQDMATFKT